MGGDSVAEDSGGLAVLAVFLIFLMMIVVLFVGFVIALIVGLPFMWIFNAVSGNFGGPTISYWISVLIIYGLQIVGSTFKSINVSS